MTEIRTTLCDLGACRCGIGARRRDRALRYSDGSPARARDVGVVSRDARPCGARERLSAAPQDRQADPSRRGHAPRIPLKGYGLLSEPAVGEATNG
ncbi:MAG: hypothetical protein RML56_06695 [Burkholderiales bacterium]|nr:hypothetical protein [Burkholderiales bacterium]